MMAALIYVGTLVLLAAVCFAQNMAFTASSRSRNSADPEYHRKVAWCSNGIYLLAQLVVWKHLWAAFTAGTIIGWILVVPMVIVYVIFTAEGSVFMMRRMLKTEKGKREVGAKVGS